MLDRELGTPEASHHEEVRSYRQPSSGQPGDVIDADLLLGDERRQLFARGQRNGRPDGGVVLARVVVDAHYSCSTRARDSSVSAGQRAFREGGRHWVRTSDPLGVNED